MDPHFTIVTEPQRDLIRITLAGFFGPAGVACFEADCAVAYGRLRCAPNAHLTLCDVTALRIQPQDVVAAFARFASDPRYTSRRLAVVTGASFARMQTRRVTNRDTVGYFTDMASAEAWLFADQTARAA